jgi:CheY-like chemotaxis protein
MGSRLCGGRDDGMRPVDGVDACKERHSAAGRSRPVGVLVADEQRLFVEAIEIAIATDERLHAVGYALDGMELIRLAGALQPQVIAVQAELPWLDGFTSMRHLRLLCPESRVLLLSESGRARDHARAGGRRGRLRLEARRAERARRCAPLRRPAPAPAGPGRAAREGLPRLSIVRP